jgi:hypothetical protein
MPAYSQPQQWAVVLEKILQDFLGFFYGEAWQGTDWVGRGRKMEGGKKPQHGHGALI